MKRVIKNKNNDAKPFRLLANPRVRELLGSYGCDFQQEDIEDIELTQSEHDRFNSDYATHSIVSFLPLSVVRTLIEELDGLKHYAFCYHDHDKFDDGTPKKPHVHIILVYQSKTYLSVSCHWFHTFTAKGISSMNIYNQWHYLTHDSDACRKAGKYQYNSADRFCDDENYFKSRMWEETNDGNDALNMYLDFMRKGITHKDMLTRYGFRYLQNYRTLQAIRVDLDHTSNCRYVKQYLTDGTLGYFDTETGDLLYRCNVDGEKLD